MTRYHHRNKAGNFADVHKHWLISLLLSQPRNGGTSLTYMESHAGSGLYHLDDAIRTDDGINRLWHSTATLPPGLQKYREAVRQNNPGQQLTSYPGSPALARRFLRPGDTAELFDNRADVIRELERYLINDPRFRVHFGDGFRGVAGLLPRPQPVVLLIDPPYEKSDELNRVSWLLPRLKQGQTPVQVAVWYPLLKEEQCRPAIDADALWVSELFPANRKGKRMYGSGMMLLNTPETLLSQAEQEGECLAELLQARIRYWRPS